MRLKWEYMTVQFTLGEIAKESFIKKFTDILNKLGRDGLEVVENIVPPSYQGYTDSEISTILLKR